MSAVNARRALPGMALLLLAWDGGAYKAELHYAGRAATNAGDDGLAQALRALETE